jgi:hypothetical protein
MYNIEGKTTRSSLDSLEGLSGSVFRPEDDGYDDARSLFNGMIDRRPTVIVRCASVDGVVQALFAGGRAGLPIAVRGGGHNISAMPWPIGDSQSIFPSCDMSRSTLPPKPPARGAEPPGPTLMPRPKHHGGLGEPGRGYRQSRLGEARLRSCLRACCRGRVCEPPRHCS